jgi:hypothetical protein
MNSVTSNLSTNQLFQLSKQILNNQDTRHVEWLMRAPERNRQDIINFIVKRAGKAPDEIVEGMAIAAAERAKPKPALTDRDAVAVRVIDLSQQGKAPVPSPLALYAHACNGGCGIRLALPLGEIESSAKSCWCANCLPKAQKRYDAGTALKASFVSKMAGVYYDHPQNDQIFNAEIQRRGLVNPSLGDLVEIFVERRADMLHPLTEGDIRAMSSAELEAREKVDPKLGGAVLLQEGQQHLKAAFQVDQTNASRLRPFAPVSTSRTGREGGL